MADARAQQAEVFVSGVRSDQRRHFDCLSVMHDHALHELDIFRRSRRQRSPRGCGQSPRGLTWRAGLHDNRRIRISLLRPDWQRHKQDQNAGGKESASPCSNSDCRSLSGAETKKLHTTWWLYETQHITSRF